MSDEHVAAGYKVIVCGHDADDCGHEEAITAEERDKGAGRGEDLPWAGDPGQDYEKVS